MVDGRGQHAFAAPVDQRGIGGVVGADGLNGLQDLFLGLHHAVISAGAVIGGGADVLIEADAVENRHSPVRKLLFIIGKLIFQRAQFPFQGADIGLEAAAGQARGQLNVILRRAEQAAQLFREKPVGPLPHLQRVHRSGGVHALVPRGPGLSVARQRFQRGDFGGAQDGHGRFRQTGHCAQQDCQRQQKGEQPFHHKETSYSS